MALVLVTAVMELLAPESVGDLRVVKPRCRVFGREGIWGGTGLWLVDVMLAGVLRLRSGIGVVSLLAFVADN